MLRYLTAGESHGPCLLAVIEGLPAGLRLDKALIDGELRRRQMGYGRGKRMSLEKDEVEVLAGLRGGVTLGSPLALRIRNRDWENWKGIMDPFSLSDEAVQHRLTCPRPGHADLAGIMKYGHKDIRNVLERASARETAARVAVGAVAKILLGEFGIRVFSHVVELGRVRAQVGSLSLQEVEERKKNSLFNCADPLAEEKMKKEVDETRKRGDSLGGIFEIIALGVPPGLGSFVQWDLRLDGRLAWVLMSIPAIKGVEIGLGFEASRTPGSKVHDEIFYSKKRGFYRGTNRAGGTEGGMSNGEPIVLRAAMKPIPTLTKPLRTVEIESKKESKAAVERSDICAVPAASVVGEAVVAIEIANCLRRKFGGDSLREMKDNFANYIKSLEEI